MYSFYSLLSLGQLTIQLVSYLVLTGERARWSTHICTYCMYGSMYVSSSADDARRFDSSVGMAASRKGCWSWLRDGQLRVM